MSLIGCPLGHYQFLPGIEPYSSGVVADKGWEIVHARLEKPLHWLDGLTKIRQYLESIGRDRHALCAVELRCPEPHSMFGFVEFNREYRGLLEDWEMLVDDANPIARTNVAPVRRPPTQTVVYAFSYTIPSKTARPTLVVAGGGELRGGLDSNNIVRAGETTDDAMAEKARCVVEIMRERLDALGTDHDLTQINVYTSHDLRPVLDEVVITTLPAAAWTGVNWHFARPPIIDIEFEMDMRGVATDIVVEL